ncbi:hypothetical protein BIFGAL_02898 [Bifidobacterium gallicum DSM 20093 = LMG 11596]|uniref:Uncharacterized protein n=1 Tax=Bifidobacterium gallicum DSM 20093 = LMG 11596 TaxID=561180 RepID=D1NSY7_9BIFI|nr:hypothetical protein BIFGAL_02898 [Bifidobacterium gallicum DSM 20093 = LMG 11596]
MVGLLLTAILALAAAHTHDGLLCLNVFVSLRDYRTPTRRFASHPCDGLPLGMRKHAASHAPRGG